MHNLFGALRADGEGLSAGDLRRYAAGVAAGEGTAGDPSESATGAVEAISTGPGLAAADGVMVAVRGRPFWRGSGESEAMTELAAEILDAYRREGTALLQRLQGSFSLAVLDTAQRRALLAVDRMGIEKLAYSIRPGCLVFSTSAEAVARAPGATTSLSNSAIFSYLFFHVVPSPDTIYAGVRKLPPACALDFRSGQSNVVRYWAPDMTGTLRAKREELNAALRLSLRTAVRAARPGPRSGAFLSGGLDSSTVAGVLSEIGPSPAKTFSIGFGHPDYDELPYARIANRHFACAAHEYTIRGADIAGTLPLIARAYDEPFGNSSAVPAYYCARLAKDAGVYHLLAGDGGDELFAGNSRYTEQRVFEWYQRVPRFLTSGLLEPLLDALPSAVNPWPIRKARGYVAKARIPLPARLEMWNFVVQLGVGQILHRDFLEGIDPGATFAHMQAVWDSSPSDSTLSRMLYYDWRLTLADNDLRKVLTTSELAGVSVSFPMLHPDVVEMSCRVPPTLMMPGRKLRHFYKEAMCGFLPEEIIQKKKHGFGLPFGLWLQESPELRELVFDNLASLKPRRIVRPDFLDHLLGLHGRDDARYYGVFIWVLAMLEQWFKEHRLAP